MCLESAETAAFPEPLLSPAGGQECEREWVVVVIKFFCFFFPFLPVGWSAGARERARVGLSPACVCMHA